MKRREFMEKTGCGLAVFMGAQFGLKAFAEASGEAENKKAKIKKILMEKMGKTEQEADAMIADMEEKLPKVKATCICKACPSYVKEEKKVGFCHRFISKSSIITDEKGCNCTQCPVYKTMNLKNGYYCTRKSELEQEMAKKKKELR